MMAATGEKDRYLGYLRLTAAGWILLSLLTAPAFYLDRERAGGTPRADAALGAACLACLSWAVAALLLLAFSARLRRWRSNGSAWLASHAAFGVVLVLVLIVLRRWWGWPVLGLGDVLHARNYVQALVVAGPGGLAMYAALWCACQLGLLRREYARLEAQIVGAELRRLRTQLNPHFLFNTLNAISELGYTDPAAADRTITQLSRLLRKSLDDSHQQEIALRDELDFLRRYLEIQQTLLRGRLQIEFDIADDTLNARVPGMILQPLVENAVIHGIGRNGGGHLTLRARREDDALVIEVADDGSGAATVSQRSGRDGIGIDNTRSRLSYLYGELAGLELKHRPGGGMTACLNIPFHEAYAFDENPHADR